MKKGKWEFLKAALNEQMMPWMLEVNPIPQYNKLASQPITTKPALLPPLCDICSQQIDNICYPAAIVQQTACVGTTGKVPSKWGQSSINSLAPGRFQFNIS